MRYDSYELILNHITSGEHIMLIKDREAFEDYKQMAYLFLNHKGKHLFEEDILSEYREGVTLEKLFSQNPDQYLQGANHERNGTRQKTWYDLWSSEEIERGDDFFDYFFVCKLRHLSLLDIDNYLSFHLEYSFKNNKQEYFRFLQLALRQHERLLNAKISDTVNEWIKINQIDNPPTELSGKNLIEKEEKIKGRIQRERGDKLTALSEVQTALLIQFLQQNNIILKGSYLNDTQAGKAFHILTGYSAHTLRQDLGIKGNPKHEDYKELYEIILKLAKSIEEKTRK